MLAVLWENERKPRVDYKGLNYINKICILRGIASSPTAHTPSITSGTAFSYCHFKNDNAHKENTACTPCAYHSRDPGISSMQSSLWCHVRSCHIKESTCTEFNGPFLFVYINTVTFEVTKFKSGMISPLNKTLVKSSQNIFSQLKHRCDPFLISLIAVLWYGDRRHKVHNILKLCYKMNKNLFFSISPFKKHIEDHPFPAASCVNFKTDKCKKPSQANISTTHAFHNFTQ